MHVTFLGARLPLTKTFVLTNGTMSSAPYPHVSKVTSFHEQAKSLADFHKLLLDHAGQDHCLFNGQMTRPLVSESRAGMTQDTPREWVVFDFDRVQAKDAADVVARYLPVECQNVSYIVQLSASMFRPDNTSWSGHIFMLLKTPTDAMKVKQWFEHLNFSLPGLTSQLSLSDSLQALHWPLDRTVAYNSKIIYIAPPRCHGFEPAVDQHIMLVKKKATHLVIAPFQPIDTVSIRQKINELRRNIGEADMDYDLVQFEGHEMLRKTDVCDIHGIRTSGDHYIRFNLNGGDSYAYFIDLRNPDVIRNFKGEPFLATKDAAPDLYKSLRKAAPGVVAKAPLDEGAEVLAFYATNQGSPVKVGVYEPVARRLTLNNATETSARAWRNEYGLTQKEFLPHMDLVFDPKSDIQYLAGTPKINTFRATEYMTRKRTVEAPSGLSNLPTTIGKIVRSMLGDPDDAVLAHFINWIACIYQTREKTGTAWVLHGRTGTGKGSFFKYVLAPIFGQEHVRVVQFGSVASQFNAYLENALFVVYDEADTYAVENQSELMTKLRHIITENPLEINQKGVKTYQAETYCNIFLAANAKAPVVITGDDRRFNIPARQEVQLFFTPNEIKGLMAGDELDSFADMLQRWPVDMAATRTVIETEARANVHESTTSINQLIAEAIIRGDLQFILDRIPSDAEATADFFNRFNPIGMLKANLDAYIDAAANGETMILGEEHLFPIFRTLIPDTRFFQDSKTWRKRHYKSLGLDVEKQHRLPGSWDKKTRGIKVEWQKPDNVTAPDSTGKVTPIKKVSKK